MPQPPLTETHLVPALPTPQRLSDYGVGIFPAAVTKSAWKKAIKKQYVTVNGAMGTTATLLNGGEEIQLTIPEERETRKVLRLPLEVRWEDDYLAVILKPAGIVVSGNQWKTVANALPHNLQPSPLPDATTPQPIHRLDYATTGLLLTGKTKSSIRTLNRLFEDQGVAKTYYAVSIGKMEAEGSITADIDGKPSHSDYVVCESVPSERFEQLTLLRLTPHTGRRHQLRKHLAGIGHPILGDKDYGQEPLILRGKGMYLHAYSLQFVHPITGEELMVTAELPKKFGKLFSFEPDS